MYTYMDIYKIVKGNSFDLFIKLQKAYISKNKQMLEDIDVAAISNLEVHLTDAFGECVAKMPFVQSGTNNSEVEPSDICVKFPPFLEEGLYGITIRGKYNGNDICSIEHRLFRIVERNGKSHIPLGIVDGEMGGMYNAKYWIELNTKEDVIFSYYGALSTTDPNKVNIEYLQQFSGVLSGQTITISTTENEDIIWVVSSVPLTFFQGGLPLEMQQSKIGELYYYHSDELISGDSTITII